jgi:uncharacterized protein
MKIAARLLLAALLLTSFSAFAQGTPETKEQKVRRLLVLLKVGDVAKQMAGAMIDSFKGSMPEVPEEVWTAFMAKVKGEELIELLIPVYSRNIEEADVDALLTFYSSPAGQRFIGKQSLIMQESMAVGEQWGAKLGRQVEEELRQKQQQ